MLKKKKTQERILGCQGRSKPQKPSLFFLFQEPCGTGLLLLLPEKTASTPQIEPFHCRSLRPEEHLAQTVHK